MTKTFKYFISGVAFVFVGALVYTTQASLSFSKAPLLQDEDTSAIDTLANVKAEGPQFKLKQDPAYPSGDLKPSEGIQLKRPSNLRSDLVFDPVSKQYVFTNKLGNINYRQPATMSIKEFQKYENKRMVRNYWQSQANGGKSIDQRGFRPSFNLGSQAMDMIFGSSTINIVPQGEAELIFGVSIRTDANPAIPVKLRKVPSFDFDEKIQMNVNGTIGERLKLGINYNTDATFEFENKTKLEYAGDEDDIIKKIEAGDVTLPLSGSLITGSQSLFGIKTEMQFGKLNVTTVLSQQKGQTQEIKVQGGAQVSDFEITADEYEANKHFFLAHAFKDKYNDAHLSSPRLTSNYTITNIEVWVTNRKAKFDDSRDIVAFVDLGETRIENLFNKKLAISNNAYPSNQSNELFDKLKDDVHNKKLGSDSTNRFETLESARKLSKSDYSIDEVLGYISLNSPLNSDEILAVAYEYMVAGDAKKYKVGEFSMDNPTKQPLMLKMLKGSNLSPTTTTWSLMMKNIYSLNAYDLSNEDFYLNIMYRDDKKGGDVTYLPENQFELSKVALLTLMGLDKVNSQLESTPDGVFDFIEGITIDKKYGRIIFPTLEPFNKALELALQNRKVDKATISKYTFPELYNSTQTKARLAAEKNKFKLKGTYKSASSSDIYLGAMNVPQGSVKVTCGGIQLAEGTDFVVDYAMGSVKIINTGLMSSGQPIKVSLENNSMFAIQTKTLIGTHLDYKFNDDFNIGGTFMNLTERPITKKVNIGDEPISNTIWGLNSTYKTNSQFITTLVDKLPFLQTKEMSSLTLTGEFAQLIPGTSSAIGKNGVAYIDDFEGCETSISVLQPYGWTLASTPSKFAEASHNNNLDYGYNRAKLAWYDIDQLFTRNNSLTPAAVKAHKEWQESVYAREIIQTDLFPKADVINNLKTDIPVLNLTYYPYLKGPYNFDTKVDNKGNLTNPEARWGGMMRAIDYNDFEAANIEYLEFWMMDPFVDDKENEGGELYFNLGNISEDVLKDGEKSFEQGLPASNADSVIVVPTVWGKVSKKNPKTSFSPEASARPKQDVGLDGLSNLEEQEKFKVYLDTIKNKVSKTVADSIAADPAGDDFRYFKDQVWDKNNADIIDRYSDYNNVENNSPVAGNDYENKSNYSTPDMEDINDDNTMYKDKESFFEYKVNITPEDLKEGQNNIVARRKTTAKVSGVNKDVYWYQFKIPITDYVKTYGDNPDFKSIRFMRMFLTGFKKKTTMRFATLELVRGEWRKYGGSLIQNGDANTAQSTQGVLDLQSVNIEENDNYVLPPGIDRVIDPNQSQLRQLNEQSMVLKVLNLADGHALAAYKTSNLDMRQYKKLRMEVHCESLPGNENKLDDGDVTVFIRIGSDYKNNYYEYEVPMKVSQFNARNPKDVWPDVNKFVIDLNLFQRIKQKRNDLTTDFLEEYEMFDGNNRIAICGNPTLSNIKTLMIGVRNPRNNASSGHKRANLEKSAIIWVNELRLTDFSDQGGWAANARAQLKLADFGNIRIAGSTMQPGFGSIEKKVNEREKVETNQFDISTDLELGKFFPEKAQVHVPVYAAYSNSTMNPQYNPLDPDIPLSAALDNAKTPAEKNAIAYNAKDVTERHSINFTNVKVNKMSKKPMFYDPANFSVSYEYYDQKSRNQSIEYNNLYRHAGNFNYIYTARPKNVSPFQKVKFLNNSALRLIKDFNFYFMPNSFSFRTNMIKSDRVLKMRNLNRPGEEEFSIPPTQERDFTWNRSYEFKYDITRSLKLDFAADNIAKIEQEGILDKSSYWHLHPEDYKRETIKQQILKGGTTTNYNHQFNVSYTVPINKLPMLSWLSANTRYSANYEWNYEPGYKVEPTIEKPEGDFIDLGNTLKNSRKIQLNSSASLTSIYNSIPFLRDLQNNNQNKKEKEKPMKTVTFEKTYFSMKAGVAKSISHKLGTEDVKVKVVDAKGNEIKGKVDVVSINRVTFTPEADVTNATVQIEAKVPAGEDYLLLALRGLGKIATGIRSVSAGYNITDGTTLPGYLRKTVLFGSENLSDGLAPGLPFILGFQNDSVGSEMAKHGWITPDEHLNMPILFGNSRTFDVRLNYEPFDGFRVDLFANHSHSENKRMYYSIYNEKEFHQTSINRTGNFSMTIMSLGSFETLPKSENVKSKNFTDFLKKRDSVGKLLYANAVKTKGIAPGSENGYTLNSQQVLIPSFLAVYGDYIGTVPLNLFPSITDIRPNWRINYDGLSDIEWVKKYCKSVTLSHSYTSTYSIGSYTSVLSYDENNKFQIGDNKAFIPELDVSGVSINEQLSPLIGLDMTWVNNFTSRIEYKKSRNIALELGSMNINEMQTNEFVVGVGYRFEQMPLSYIVPGNTTSNIKSDLNLRSDFSLRSDIYAIRNIIDGQVNVNQGKQNMTISVSADYMLSDKLTVRLFYDRMLTDPYTSDSYRTTDTKFGFSIRFTLAQ